MDIRMGSTVHCTDGKCGHVDDVVVEKGTYQVVGIIVKRGTFAPRHIVVSLDLIYDVDPDRVFVRTASSELEGFPNLMESDYVPVSGEPHHHPDREDEALLMTSPEIGNGLPLTPLDADFEEPLLERDVKNIPQNSIVVGASTQVETPAGKIGSLERVLFDPISNKITHLVVKRHPGSGYVTVPAQSIMWFGEKRIGLNLSTEEIASLTHPPIH